jgi:hypothetical protein
VRADASADDEVIMSVERKSFAGVRALGDEEFDDHWSVTLDRTG